MKKIITLFLTFISIQSFATIYLISGNQNITCSIGDTLRFTSGCNGQAPYDFFITDASNTNVFTQFAVTLPYDYVITGNEARWDLVWDDVNVCGTHGTITLVTGINEVNNSESTISIFPNPVITEFTFSTKYDLQNASIMIYNLEGRLVKEINDVCGKNILLERGNLQAGFYFIRISENGETMGTGKIIIAD